MYITEIKHKIKHYKLPHDSISSTWMSSVERIFLSWSVKSERSEAIFTLITSVKGMILLQYPWISVTHRRFKQNESLVDTTLHESWIYKIPPSTERWRSPRWKMPGFKQSEHLAARPRTLRWRYHCCSFPNRLSVNKSGWNSRWGADVTVFRESGMVEGSLFRSTFNTWK